MAAERFFECRVRRKKDGTFYMEGHALPKGVPVRESKTTPSKFQGEIYFEIKDNKKLPQLPPSDIIH